ncbi:hypothetical protein GOP47_0003675 [Adiantum capillus-veneris]|uniref:Uncharacterized protein n=1 Tax=Adiantum capillus-veneris TaxID=13818 RepID=A0A9D4V6R4_ADICA|nr:hypothetical protein GOP47_0003675 [Adiantum capillus-veneris]
MSTPNSIKILDEERRKENRMPEEQKRACTRRLSDSTPPVPFAGGFPPIFPPIPDANASSTIADPAFTLGAVFVNAAHFKTHPSVRASLKYV